MIRCSFENGNKTTLRHVVADAIAVKGEKLLLVKRAKHLVNGGKWALPGGYVDRGEKIEQAAIREFKEETGLNGKAIRLFKIIDDIGNKNDDRQNVKFVYEVDAKGNLSKNDESEEVKWFNFDNLPKEEEFAFDHFQIISDFIKGKNSQ